MDEGHELDDKRERLMRLCRDAGLGGVLLGTQPNFAWLTGGRSNRIDGTRELGAGALLLTADGRRIVLANAIEMPRLLDEAMKDIPCEAIEYPWVDDHGSPDNVIRLARQVTGGNEVRMGADWPWPDAVPMELPVARVRARLTGAEVLRYRALGRDAGQAIGTLCRTIEPGLSEYDVERQVADAVAGVGARAMVVLVGADDRIARYRHPRPTSTLWRRLLLIVVCAERGGLVVALSRLVSAGPVPASLAERTVAAAGVFERLLGATSPNATGRDLFAVAVRAYADAGFAGEERRHHQGGAIGYRSRDWLAHPASDEQVQPRQAFAWNPSITGTKVEDTALLVDGEMEIVTGSPGWPSISIDVGGTTLVAPLVLAR